MDHAFCSFFVNDCHEWFKASIHGSIWLNFQNTLHQGIFEAWPCKGYCSLVRFLSIVIMGGLGPLRELHPSGVFFAFSGVTSVLMFFSDLCTPLVCSSHVLACFVVSVYYCFSCDLCTPEVFFSHLLACLLVLVYHCFSVICTPLCCVLLKFWRVPCYWCTIVFW